MQNVLKKLFNIQQEINVPKNQRNNFGNYNFRNCEDIMEASKPICKKYNCLLTCSDSIAVFGENDPCEYEETYYDKELKKENIKHVVTGCQRYYVKAIATLYDLDSEESISTVAYAREEENKKGMDGSQVTGASSSYARKYALNGLLQLDDNKDADTNEFSKTQGKTTKTTTTTTAKIISDSQIKLINTLLSQKEDKEKAKKELYEKFNITTIKGVSSSVATEMIKYLKGE